MNVLFIIIEIRYFQIIYSELDYITLQRENVIIMQFSIMTLRHSLRLSSRGLWCLQDVMASLLLLHHVVRLVAGDYHQVEGPVADVESEEEDGEEIGGSTVQV